MPLAYGARDAPAHDGSVFEGRSDSASPLRAIPPPQRILNDEADTMAGDWYGQQAMGNPVPPPSQTDIQATPGGLGDTPPLGFGSGLGCGSAGVLHEPVFGAGGSLHFFAATA